MDTILKSAQAASEIKPTLQQYINKFNRKLTSMRKDTLANSKKKPSKLWIYPAEWKKFTQRSKMPQKIPQQQEKFLNEQIMSPTFPPVNNQNKNVDLSSDVEIIKITTIVEAIRQKRQNMAQMLEAAKNIQKIIGKRRSKRSSYESGKNSAKDSRHGRQGKTFVSNKRSRSKPNYRKQQTRTLPTRKRETKMRNENATDLKAANNVAIPSTVFYKRIWEYINGTRPHSDIISDYNSLEDNSEKDNLTCTDKERITASQSQKDNAQVKNPDVEPERDFYKRIWDIINATQLNENAKARFKRNANIPKSNTISTPLCVQEGTINYEDKQEQAAKTDINLPEITDSGPYISGFWSVANKTQWRPTKIPVPNTAELNNDPILSPILNSASEVEDLNKLLEVENVDYSSLNNSTYTNEARNSSQEIIAEPGPPYSSEESFATSSFSPAKSAVDKPSQEKNQAERAENYSTATTPGYDPSNIPYVEVPDYSDQQETSLDKSNKSTTAARYKEYDDGDYDYGSKRLRDADNFSSKSPSAEIKVVQTESDEPKTSLNANNSHSSCTESKDSTECVDKYDVEGTKLHNNTENVTNDDVHRSAEGSAESEENENSEFVDFDDYKKPINWAEFFKNNPILENIQATFSKKYDSKENADRTEESEEVETYATDPKEQSHDYITKNQDSQDHHALDDGDKAKEETDSYVKKEAKESEIINEDHPFPYYDNFFKRTFEKGSDKESEYDYKENPDRTKKEIEEVETYAADPKEYKENPDRSEESEEVKTYATDPKEHKENPDRSEESEEVKTYATDPKEHKESPDRSEESEEVKTYATDPKEQSQDYFAKNEDYHGNHKTVSDDRDEANDREEETDSHERKEEEESEVNDEDPYDNKDFFRHIFGKDNAKESSDTADTENEFLSRYFTKDVLLQLRDNSTAEEDRQREESRNREDIQKTLSSILEKKDQFSRLDENLNKMIEKGEAIPIKYNNFWSLQYESPHTRNEDNEEEKENSKEEA